MANALARYVVLLEAQSARYEKELTRAQTKLQRFEKQNQRSLAAIKKGFAAFGVGIGLNEIARFADAAVKLGASIADAAANAGISAERLQRLQYAFEQNGVETKEFDLAMQKLNRRLGLFIQDGGGPAAAAIKRLGLETDIASGKIRTSEALFDAAVAKMQDIETAAERAAIASGLFGEDAGPKLVQALSLGTKGLREYEAAASGIWSDKQVQQAAAIDDQFQRLSRTIGNTLKSAIVSATAAMSQFWGSAATVVTSAEIEAQIAALEKTATYYRDQLTKGFIPQGGSGAQTLAAIEAQLDELYKRLVALSDAKVTIPVEVEVVGTGADPFPIKDLAGLTDEGGFPTVFAGPNMFPDRAQFEEVRGQLAALEEQALRSQGRMAEAIRMAADEQIAQWSKVAEETPAFAEQAARAIELINQKTVADIGSTAQDVTDAARELGMTFTSAFEDAIVGGEKLSQVLRGLAQDLARMLVRKTLFAPIAGWFDKLIPEPRAAGGPVSGGRPYLVGEEGPELFVPRASGSILPNGAGGSVVINQTIQAGLPPQWTAQLATATRIAASAAKQEIQREFGGRR